MLLDSKVPIYLFVLHSPGEIDHVMESTSAIIIFIEIRLKKQTEISIFTMAKTKIALNGPHR